jgi:hypothetical protein
LVFPKLWLAYVIPLYPHSQVEVQPHGRVQDPPSEAANPKHEILNAKQKKGKANSSQQSTNTQNVLNFDI